MKVPVFFTLHSLSKFGFLCLQQLFVLEIPKEFIDSAITANRHRYFWAEETAHAKIYLSDIVTEVQKSCGTDFDSWQV